MTTTAVYTAQDALLALVNDLDAIGGDYPWRVDLGFPQKAAVQSKHIWIAGDVDPATQVFGLTVPGDKDETFDLRVFVVCTAKATDYVTPRGRVKTVTDELKTDVHVNFTLDGTVEWAHVSSTSVDDAQPADDLRQVLEVVNITCRAWLT